MAIEFGRYVSGLGLLVALLFIASHVVRGWLDTNLTSVKRNQREMMDAPDETATIDIEAKKSGTKVHDAATDIPLSGNEEELPLSPTQRIHQKKKSNLMPLGPLSARTRGLGTPTTTTTKKKPGSGDKSKRNDTTATTSGGDPEEQGGEGGAGGSAGGSGGDAAAGGNGTSSFASVTDEPVPAGMKRTVNNKVVPIFHAWSPDDDWLEQKRFCIRSGPGPSGGGSSEGEQQPLVNLSRWNRTTLWLPPEALVTTTTKAPSAEGSNGAGENVDGSDALTIPPRRKPSIGGIIRADAATSPEPLPWGDPLLWTFPERRPPMDPNLTQRYKRLSPRALYCMDGWIGFRPKAMVNHQSNPYLADAAWTNRTLALIKQRKMLNYYGDLYLYDVIDKFPWLFQNKEIVIPGSELPHYELLALVYGKAKKVLTLEYRKYDVPEPLELMLVGEFWEAQGVSQQRIYDYLARLTADGATAGGGRGGSARVFQRRDAQQFSPPTLPLQFDVVLSYSNFEHDGLGRYNDPIDPNGDLKAMKESWGLLKPGGFLVWGGPISRSDCTCYNLHRVYGPKRLRWLFSGFIPLAAFGPPPRLYCCSSAVKQTVIVLQKRCEYTSPMTPRDEALLFSMLGPFHGRVGRRK